MQFRLGKEAFVRVRSTCSGVKFSEGVVASRVRPRSQPVRPTAVESSESLPESADAASI